MLNNVTINIEDTITLYSKLYKIVLTIGNNNGGHYYMDGYLRLIKRITDCNSTILYNQIKVTSSNRRTIDSIRDELVQINNDLDLELAGFLYEEDKIYKLDIYSNNCFEGQFRNKNLKQILSRVKEMYLKLLSLAGIR